MSKTKFNKEQQQAIDSFTSIDNPKSVFVSASAGTGKTTMITHAYLKLLEQGIAPSQIVALTFTNNATNEMFMRIRSLVRDSLYNSKGVNKKRWAEIYNQLGREANISTIDKFASKLIKKYSYRLDLLPSINIIGDYDEQNIKIIKYIIESLLKNNAKYKSIYGSMKLYEQHKKDTFIENIIKFINNIKPSVGNFDNLKKSLLEIELKDFNQNIYRNITTAIDSIWHYDHSGATATKAKDLLNIHKDNILSLDTISKLYETKTEDNKQQLRLCLSSTDALIKDLKVGRLAELKEIGTTLTTKLLPYYRNIILNIVLRVDYKNTIENIINFLEQIFNEYEKQKTQLNSLTFNDLISKAIDLLEDPKIGDEIRKSIRYVIVDETQDTNDLQYSLVNHLLFGRDKIDEEILLQSSKVAFIVGDRKQSIYRFRNANITSFLNLEQIFTNGSNSESIYLNRNYRSDAYLIDFFNNIFTSIFDSDEIQYSTHDDLISSKSDVDNNQVNSHEQVQQHKNIEYLVFENQDKGVKISAAEKNQMEAHAAAYHIRNRCNADQNLQYDRFALLLPVFTNLHNYIEALTKYNIPFYISSGKGFFNRSEIAHIINFLKYLVLKENQLLPLILNKIFFDISESELYQINEKFLTTDFSLKDLFSIDKNNALECFNDVPKLKDKIISIRKIIFKLFDYAHFENSSVVINTIINETRFNAYLMTTSEAEFAYSNVEKFIAMAHTHEREQSGNNIYTFIEGISSQSNADEKYAAVPLLKVNAITIMTVHASKGLEFENVIVGSLSSARRSNFAEKEFTFIDEHAHIPIHTEDEVFELCKVDKNFDIQRQLSERCRLLYVALTRAKKSLTLIGEGNASSYRATIEEYYKVSSGGRMFIDNAISNILQRDYSSSSVENDTKSNNIDIKVYKYDEHIHEHNHSHNYPIEEKTARHTNNTIKISGENITTIYKENYNSPKKIVKRASDSNASKNENKNTKIEESSIFLHNITTLLENKIEEHSEHEEIEWYEYDIFGGENSVDDSKYMEIMDLGTMVHEILELFNHHQYIASGQEYINMLIGNAQKQLSKYSNGDVFLPMVETALQTYINSTHIQNVLNGREEIFMREHAFEKRSTDENGNINITRSKIDLVTLDTTNKIYYIIDYKVASEHGCRFKDTYQSQMNAYQEAMSGFLKIDKEQIKTQLMYLL